MTNYKKLAELIEQTLINQEIQARIEVGSTDNIKWEEIITDSTMVYGVLTMRGGNSVKISDGAIAYEYLNLTLALPNNEKNDYAIAAEKVGDAMEILCANAQEIDAKPVIIADNGRTSTDFRIIKGANRVGIFTQSLQVATADELLDAADTTITITVGETEYAFKGVFNYSISKIREYDTNIIKGSIYSQNTFKSISKVVTIDYYKLNEDTLHLLLETDILKVHIKINDGADVIDLDMGIKEVLDTGVRGQYITCRATFISGVI